MLRVFTDADGVIHMHLEGNDAPREARVIESGLRHCSPGGDTEILLGKQRVHLRVNPGASRSGPPVPIPIS